MLDTKKVLGWTNAQIKDLIALKQAQEKEGVNADKLRDLINGSKKKIAKEEKNLEAPLLKKLLLDRFAKKLNQDPLMLKFVKVKDLLIDQYDAWIAEGILSKPAAKVLYHHLLKKITRYEVIETKNLLEPILDESLKWKSNVQKLKEFLTSSQNKTLQDIKKINEALLIASTNAETYQINKIFTPKDIASLVSSLTTPETVELFRHPVVAENKGFKSLALHETILAQASQPNASKLQALIGLLTQGDIVFMANSITDEVLHNFLADIKKNQFIAEGTKQKLIFKPLLKSGFISEDVLRKLLASDIPTKRTADEMEEAGEIDPELKFSRDEEADGGYASASISPITDDERCTTPVDHYTQLTADFTPIRPPMLEGGEYADLDVIGLGLNQYE
jgi:hypothetical protein